MSDTTMVAADRRVMPRSSSSASTPYAPTEPKHPAAATGDERRKRASRKRPMIHDLGVDEGEPYLVMELVAGPSLRQVLDAHGTLALYQREGGRELERAGHTFALEAGDDRARAFADRSRSSATSARALRMHDHTSFEAFWHRTCDELLVKRDPFAR